MAATAVEAWDERWATPEGRSDWLMPHPAVAALVPVLKARGRPVAPDTFIRGSGAKAHPHYYCDLAGLTALFAGFELLSLTQEEQRRPGSWHWHILAERR